MTTLNTTSTVSANLYPFVTKAQLKERLEADFSFRCEAMTILLALQTEAEQATAQTINKNRQGFMSSHAVNGTRIAKKLRAGEPLADEDTVLINKIAPCYSRQLAVYYRAKALAEQPALKAVAAVFGV